MYDVQMKQDGASAVIISGNKILLFHRDDIETIPFPDCWQLPGGGIEDGETPLQGLQRELFEEVTYIPKKLQPVGYFDNMLGKSYIYIAYVSADEEKQFVHKKDEGQEIGFFTIEESLKINLTPPLRWFVENKRAEIKQIIEEHKIPASEKLEMQKWT
jgi:8-oxo-dGTP diphosphatase